MKTLVITDVQHDFMPGGALSVPHGNEIVPMINALIPQFDHVIATMDWHPLNHVSFETLWPVHCVQNTHGANLGTGLHKERIEEIFRKGINPLVDSYSAFFDEARHRSTGLEQYWRDHQLNDLYFVGLATDYCVLYSVLDALDLGFQVTVIRDGCRGINLQPDDEEKAFKRMENKGAKIVFAKDLIH